MKDDIYGGGKNPPYSLYQGEDGRWGLVDGSGVKLPAVFNRVDDELFSQCCNEVVTFSEEDGFELLCWYDPSEVWFNFTFDDPAYPEEYMEFLWKRPTKPIGDYKEIIYSRIPATSHWFIDYIINPREFDDDTFTYTVIRDYLALHPEVKTPSITNPLLDPIMTDKSIDKDIRHALWRAKVRLDSDILCYLEDTEL